MVQGLFGLSGTKYRMVLAEFLDNTNIKVKRNNKMDFWFLQEDSESTYL